MNVSKANGMSVSNETHDELAKIGNVLTSCNTLWESLGVLENHLGARVGRHLENLVLANENKAAREAKNS